MKARSVQFNRKILQAVLITVTILAALGFFFVFRLLAAEQQKMLDSLMKSTAAKNEITRYSLLLSDAEKGKRGFLATGSYQYLFSYNFARCQLQIELPYLVSLTQPDQRIQSDLEKLNTTIRAEFEEADRLISTIGTDGRPVSVVDVDRGLEFSRLAREVLDSIQSREDQLINGRRNAAQASIRLQEGLSTLLLILSAAAVIGAGTLILRIRQLQSIITICAWTQRVNYNGKWMRMEQFLWERFKVKVSHGISEEAFDGVMGVVGKKLTVSDSPKEKAGDAKGKIDHPSPSR